MLKCVKYKSIVIGKLYIYSNKEMKLPNINDNNNEFRIN